MEINWVWVGIDLILEERAEIGKAEDADIVMYCTVLGLINYAVIDWLQK